MQIGRNYKYWHWIRKLSIIFRIYRTFHQLIIICSGIRITSYNEKYLIPDRLLQMSSVLSSVLALQASMQKA